MITCIFLKPQVLSQTEPKVEVSNSRLQTDVIQLWRRCGRVSGYMQHGYYWVLHIDQTITVNLVQVDNDRLIEK